jgi:hypothetical protein
MTSTEGQSTMLAMMRTVMQRLEVMEQNISNIQSKSKSKRTPTKKKAKARPKTITIDDDDDDSDDDGAPLHRTPTPVAVKDNRMSWYARVMGLVDSAWLAPRFGSRLYAQQTYLGKEVDSYSLNRPLFLLFAGAILREAGRPTRAKNLALIKEALRKRRNYHLKCWRRKKPPKNAPENWKPTHAQLRYGGALAQESQELLEFLDAAQAYKKTRPEPKLSNNDSNDSTATDSNDSTATAKNDNSDGSDNNDSDDNNDDNDNNKDGSDGRYTYTGVFQHLHDSEHLFSTPPTHARTHTRTVSQAHKNQQQGWQRWQKRPH